MENAKKLSRRIAFPIVSRLFGASVRLLRQTRPDWQPRRWSNAELRKLGSRFTGAVINVSGWEDQDQEGGRYLDYFPGSTSYAVSNVGGARGGVRSDDIHLDLTEPVPEEYRQKFDVVFNYTTLEHIYDTRTALNNLCALSRDIVVLTVPFMQVGHWEESSYEDYWRFTKFSLERLFEERGYSVLYLSSNHNPVYPIYYFCVASSHPERWGEKLTAIPRNEASSVSESGSLYSRRVAPGCKLMT